MENGIPMVSIIVTTYNREQYLRETIQSILNQIYTNFELIVVDNFSNYDFFSVIESFNDCRIRPFQNHNNGVIAVNRNYGISKALGDYLAFCDDDDLWTIDKLKLQVEAYKRKTILCTSSTLIDEIGNYLKSVKCKKYNSKYQLYVGSRISLSSVFVEKTPDIIFDESPIYAGIEDWALWIVLIHRGYEIDILQGNLLMYRVTTTNFSKSMKLHRPIKQLAFLCNFILQEDKYSKKHLILAIINNLFFYVYYSMISKK